LLSNSGSISIEASRPFSFGGKMGIEERLVSNALKTEYTDLPQRDRDTVKLAILDVIGCMIAGAMAPGCNSVRELVVRWGGEPESTIIVFGDKVPSPNAAFVNSTMARALDFDSTWVRGLHMSAASVPAALAVAEMCIGISGKEFLTAIVAGEDLAARLHLATSEYGGFEPTGVCGVLGLAVMAARLMGLDERQALDALAIAFNRSAGSFQPNIDGALMVRVLEGLAARSGIESALLAQRGITGGKDTLEGTYGYFRLFSNDRYDKQILTHNLGKEFLGARETTIKKYPACGGATSAIDATLQLVSENKIRTEDVDEIIVYSNQDFHNTLGKPFKIGPNPQVDAQFSYPYTVACALVRRRFTIRDIAPETIDDSEVLQIAAKVHPKVDNNLKKDSFRASSVHIYTKDGKEYSKQVTYPRGDPHNPLSRDEIIEKFRSCVKFAPRPLERGSDDRIIQMIDELERLSSVSQLIQLLVVNS
jgi:2-methylcitrate dehydratase PrpD